MWNRRPQPLNELHSYNAHPQPLLSNVICGVIKRRSYSVAFATLLLFGLCYNVLLTRVPLKAEPQPTTPPRLAVRTIPAQNTQQDETKKLIPQTESLSLQLPKRIAETASSPESQRTPEQTNTSPPISAWQPEGKRPTADASKYILSVAGMERENKFIIDAFLDASRTEVLFPALSRGHNSFGACIFHPTDGGAECPESSVSVQYVGEDHGRPWKQLVAKCSVCRNDFHGNVSFSWNPKTSIPIKQPQARDGTEKPLHTTICVQPLFWPTDADPRLVGDVLIEWMEYHLMVHNIERFYLYHVASHEWTKQVIAYYALQGVAKVVDWRFVETHPAWINAQVTSHHHCIYSERGHSRYGMSIDLDEFIWHDQDKKWREITAEWEKSRNYESIGAWELRSWDHGALCDYNTSSTLWTQRMVWRDDAVNDGHSWAGRCKDVYKPERMHMTMVHNPVMLDGALVEVPHEEVHLKHYYGLLRYRPDQLCKEPELSKVRDDRMRRYGPELDRRVAAVKEWISQHRPFAEQLKNSKEYP